MIHKTRGALAAQSQLGANSAIGRKHVRADGGVVASMRSVVRLEGSRLQVRL